ncbi:hypothetical protein SALBM311S_11180 [Streptomyces alboniger]
MFPFFCNVTSGRARNGIPAAVDNRPRRAAGGVRSGRMTDLEAELRRAVGARSASTSPPGRSVTMDASNYRRVPLGVSPRDADDVAAVLGGVPGPWRPVVPRGGGTSIPRGDGPRVVLTFAEALEGLVPSTRRRYRPVAGQTHCHQHAAPGATRPTAGCVKPLCSPAN